MAFQLEVWLVRCSKRQNVFQNLIKHLVENLFQEFEMELREDPRLDEEESQVGIEIDDVEAEESMHLKSK